MSTYVVNYYCSDFYRDDGSIKVVGLYNSVEKAYQSLLNYKLQLEDKINEIVTETYNINFSEYLANLESKETEENGLVTKRFEGLLGDNYFVYELIYRSSFLVGKKVKFSLDCIYSNYEQIILEVKNIE